MIVVVDLLFVNVLLCVSVYICLASVLLLFLVHSCRFNIDSSVHSGTLVSPCLYVFVLTLTSGVSVFLNVYIVQCDYSRSRHCLSSDFRFRAIQHE